MGWHLDYVDDPELTYRQLLATFVPATDCDFLNTICNGIFDVLQDTCYYPKCGVQVSSL